METGACPSTNSWWKSLQARKPLIAFRMRRVVSGAMFTVHPIVWGKKLDGPEVEKPDLACDVCDYRCKSTTETTEHALWECAITGRIREAAMYRGLGVVRDGLPAATALHGIIPRGADEDAKKRARMIQTYLVNVREECEVTHLQPVG
eukprot:TRINITY_DN6033_c0_g2_i5.p1 TRINITY_DN6033_c0_g2~~TRINITY_DN6033_c0_g2_i5.p1  ORF type:complete len:148 (+),score=14.89 TRINITY_DN6033_c0_g2_i5:771-1214(+)